MSIDKVSIILCKTVKIMTSLSYPILYLCIIGMTILTVIDIILRSFFGSNIQGITEISTYLLVLIGFLGLTLAQVAERHITFSILFNWVSPYKKYILQKINQVFLIFVSFLLVYAGTKKAISSFIERESSWFGTYILPVWFLRFAVTVSFGFLILQFLANYFQTGKDDQKYVKKQ